MGLGRHLPSPDPEHSQARLESAACRFDHFASCCFTLSCSAAFISTQLFLPANKEVGPWRSVHRGLVKRLSCQRGDQGLPGPGSNTASVYGQEPSPGAVWGKKCCLTLLSSNLLNITHSHKLKLLFPEFLPRK